MSLALLALAALGVLPGPPMDRAAAERTAELLRLLADATRLRVLSVAAGESGIGAAEIAARLGESPATVAAHVDVLVTAGCLEVCSPIPDGPPVYRVTDAAIARLVRRSPERQG